MFSPKILGILIGLAAGAAIVALIPSRAERRAQAGPVLSDCDGRLKAVVIQYVSGAEFAASVYRDFLRQLPGDVMVHVMCPDRPAWEELRARVGTVASTLNPIFTSHPMTPWSRDRWVVLRPKEERRWTILASRGENGAETWPARRGDEQLAFDLAGISRELRAERSSLYFDGGDFVADEQTVFVAPGAIRRNLQHTAADLAELRRKLSEQLGREVVLLENAPDHHAGMFMMSAGDRTVVVGDPSLARTSPLPPLSVAPDFSLATQAKFDSVATQAQAAGYRVVRMPIVPGDDGRTYLTYLNVILDQRDGKRIVYMPVYRGADSLNAAAAQVWRSVGYEVRKVDCTEAFVHFGSLRCLVNVLDRG